MKLTKEKRDYLRQAPLINKGVYCEDLLDDLDELEQVAAGLRGEISTLTANAAVARDYQVKLERENAELRASLSSDSGPKEFYSKEEL